MRFEVQYLKYANWWCSGGATAQILDTVLYVIRGIGLDGDGLGREGRQNFSSQLFLRVLDFAGYEGSRFQDIQVMK